MSGFDRPVSLKDGKVGYWKASHPFDFERRCENGHVILGRSTRMWVEDDEGVATEASHGHPRKYYCVDCARDLGAGDPPRRYF